jgi:hypothetical protein
MWFEMLADTQAETRDGIDELINCDVVSIRYALLTQLLGKMVDPQRDAMSIQRGDAATAEAAGTPGVFAKQTWCLGWRKPDKFLAPVPTLTSTTRCAVHGWTLVTSRVETGAFGKG